MSAAELGAPTFQLRHSPPTDALTMAKYRGRIKRQVLTCTECELHRKQPITGPEHNPQHHVPVPYHGPASATFAVVGEAPGPEESERGRPFIGKSGKLLRSLMTAVELDPDDALWLNTVSCFPNIEGTIRAPSEAEQMACRPNLMDQLACADTKYVLLVGAKAFNAFRSDLQITKHHGRVFLWLETYVVMGIIHPAAALRGKAHFKAVIKDDLAVWRDMVEGGDDPLGFVGEGSCVRCEGNSGEVVWVDRDGVPYCGKHRDAFKRTWEKERKRWSNARVEQLSVF